MRQSNAANQQDTIEVPFIEVIQHGKPMLLTALPAKVIGRISYASVRGKDQEQGAVQRVLNERRISDIRDFTLGGGYYPNSIILNWVSGTPLRRSGDRIVVPIGQKLAQLIDGQHRVAGLRAAVEENPEVGDMQIPVVIFEGLDTRFCADVFLAINTEQKPVPRSLVVDLYDVASEQLIDTAVARARDIATFLNEDRISPYYGDIKFPGEDRRKGGIALSTVTTALKGLVEEKGVFWQVGVREFELQKRIILNLFQALKDEYQDEWGTRDNAFVYGSGFTAAIDLLRLKLIPICIRRKSFEVSMIRSVLPLRHNGLIRQSEVKGSSGREAVRLIYQRLVDALEAMDEAPKILV